MLDIEIVTPPTQTALDVVSLDEFASHLRLSAALRNNATWVENMTAALKEAVDDLHGMDGSLNRMVLPCTVKRYLHGFPSRGKPIVLPYPNPIGRAAGRERGCRHVSIQEVTVTLKKQKNTQNNSTS